MNINKISNINTWIEILRDDNRGMDCMEITIGEFEKKETGFIKKILEFVYTSYEMNNEMNDEINNQLTNKIINFRSNCFGYTILMYAVQFCKIALCEDEIKLFLEYYFKRGRVVKKSYKEYINAKTNFEWTALMIACRYCNTTSSERAIELLLTKGGENSSTSFGRGDGGDIDINAKTNYGYTALMISALNCKTKSNIKAIEMILSYSSFGKNGDKESVDINAKNNEGRTALMFACRYCKTDSNEKAIELLLNKEDIDINAKNNNGYTALMLAIINDYDDKIIQLFINKGALLNREMIKSINIIDTNIASDKCKLYEYYIEKLETQNQQLRLLKPIYTEDDVMRSIVLNYI